jgi:hypothetical protein
LSVISLDIDVGLSSSAVASPSTSVRLTLTTKDFKRIVSHLNLLECISFSDDALGVQDGQATD